MRQRESSNRRRRSPERDHGPRSDRWMISYADFVTLLFAVFIVLFMSVQMERGGEAAAQLKGSFRRATPEKVEKAEPDVPLSSSDPAPGAMTALQGTVDDFIDRAGLEERIQTRLERRGLVVRLVEAGFFATGRAEPRAEAVPIIDALGRMFAASSHHLRVEGHTDDTPIRTSRFPSNWELSTARATWLVSRLADRFGLEPERLSAAGYGEFRPIASNDTAAGRALNRRVDIVLLSPAIAAAEEPVASYERVDR